MRRSLPDLAGSAGAAFADPLLVARFSGLGRPDPEKARENRVNARSVRQFLLTTFDGIGAAGAEKILSATKMGPRQSPSKLKEQDIAQLYMAMKNVNLTEGQTMQVLRYANRVPLQFQPAACAITQAVVANNWRAYGLSQSRG